MSLLLAMRTSKAATASIKIAMMTSDHNLPLSSFYKDTSFSFFVVLNKQIRPRFLVSSDFITSLSPEKPRDVTSIPSVFKRVQRWPVS